MERAAAAASLPATGTGRFSRLSRATLAISAAAVAGAFLLSTCGPGPLAIGALAAPAQDVPGGDPARGRVAIDRYGCGACHIIPGVVGARGRVGPSLAGGASRAVIAGRLANTPENLIRWIEAPQSVSPGSVMPDMGVTEQDAKDIAEYLLGLGR